MTKEQMYAFLGEKITLVIPNGLWRIIMLSVSDLIDDVETDNLKGQNINEMLMPVFENENQKTQWFSKMLQTEIMSTQKAKQRSKSDLTSI